MDVTKPYKFIGFATLPKILDFRPVLTGSDRSGVLPDAPGLLHSEICILWVPSPNWVPEGNLAGFFGVHF